MSQVREDQHLCERTRSTPMVRPIAAEMEIDPDVVRLERARMDVAVAEMTGKAPLALEVALQRGKLIDIRNDRDHVRDGSGRARDAAQTDHSVSSVRPAGSLERLTTTMTVERRLVRVTNGALTQGPLLAL